MELWHERMKEFRLAKGWGQGRLAEEAELSQTLISLMEKGKRDYTKKNIEPIAKALDITIAHFFAPNIATLNPRLDLLNARLNTVKSILASDTPPKGKEKRKSYKALQKLLKI